MQDLEDRSADRLFAGYPLRSSFALAIPEADPVLAIDHVEADRKRVDDLLGEPALLLDLAEAELDLALQLPRTLRIREKRRDEISERDEEEEILFLTGASSRACAKKSE